MWAERVVSNNIAGLTSYDSLATGASVTASVTWAGSCGVGKFLNLIALLPSGGIPFFVQGQAFNTGSGAISTYSFSLSGVTAGNTFIIDLACNSSGTVLFGCYLEDLTGNQTFLPLFGTKASGAGVYSACFTGKIMASGTYNFKLVCRSGPGTWQTFDGLSVAAHEYACCAPISVSFSQSGNADGVNSYLTSSSGSWTSWFNDCLAVIGGSNYEISIESTTTKLDTNDPSSGSGIVLAGGAYSVVPFGPPEFGGIGAGCFSPYSPAETFGSGSIVLFTAPNNFALGIGGNGDFTLTTVAISPPAQSLLHMFKADVNYCAGGATPDQTTGGDELPSPDWLYILEPGSLSPLVQNQWTDQSIRLSMAESLSFSWIVKQRGSAKIPLYIAEGDSYMPTIGSQVRLWDLTDAGVFSVFWGTIDDLEVKWLGLDGDRIVTMTCVSLEQCFDTIRLPSLLFTNQTAGEIFTSLLGYASGWPGSTGTIDAGASIANFLIEGYPSISDSYRKLATLSEYVWGVDPATGQIYFTSPNLTPSPFLVDAEDVLWEQMTLKEERHDYRNRQIMQPNANAAVLSSEYFVGTGQLDFTLLRPVDQVTNAWVTQNIQNSATGTFSAQPNPGDTVTIGFGPNEVWQANFAYSVGAQILDPNGYVQVVTAATGSSGATQPSWIDIYGETTTDHDVLWKNQGPLGFGGNVAIYTFVTAIDNTQFGQVLIGANVAATAQNLADAINAIAAQAGTTFSLPTWENPQVNADEPAGASTIVVRNKAAGAGFVSALSAGGSSFSFNAAATFGGKTSTGTITVNVGIQGQTLGGSGPTLVYTPGSAAVSLATPLDSGSNLQVEYKAANAGYIIVENTADVAIRAAIEGGTGKYQQSSSDDTAVTMSEALQLAQQQLAAYGVIPSTLEFTTFQAGLYVGQVLDVVLASPVAAVGFGDLVNTTLSPLAGQWFIQEINAEAIPLYLEQAGEPVYLPGPNGGHYRYTVRCIDVTQVGSWIDFWEGLSGGSGSAAGSALFPGGGSLGGDTNQTGSYSARFTAVAGTALTITHGLNTTVLIAQAFDSSGNLAAFGNLTVVDANNISVTFGIGFNGTIVVIGA